MQVRHDESGNLFLISRMNERREKNKLPQLQSVAYWWYQLLFRIAIVQIQTIYLKITHKFRTQTVS